MSLYAQRVTWIVIAMLTLILTITLFSDKAELADAAPSGNGVAHSGGATADPSPPWEYTPGRKRK